MARVDFYVLAESGPVSRQRFACRLAEKAWRLNHSIHIRTATRQEAEQLDELLWTFRDGSFVPHELGAGGAAAQTEAPITIGFDAADGSRGELLINLTDELPNDIDAFGRIAEIVTSDEDCRARSRKLYAGYRSQGYSLESHKL